MNCRRLVPLTGTRTFFSGPEGDDVLLAQALHELLCDLLAQPFAVMQRVPPAGLADDGHRIRSGQAGSGTSNQVLNREQSRELAGGQPRETAGSG